MVIVRTIALAVSVIVATAISADSTYAFRFITGNATFHHRGLPGHQQRKVVKKNGNGPSSRHPLHQCPNGEHWFQAHWGGRVWAGHCVRNR